MRIIVSMVRNKYAHDFCKEDSAFTRSKIGAGNIIIKELMMFPIRSNAER